MKLYEIAHARAGDKGNISNIVVVANTRGDYETLRGVLTATRVKAHFEDLVQGAVHRYELPKLLALNFVMHGSLQGGVTKSTALDTHGKSLSSALLNITL
jgi:hypothetical protein